VAAPVYRCSFPILLDAELTLTTPPGLFTTEWTGAKAEPIDRPGVEDMARVVRWIDESPDNGSTKPPSR
jgi:hypothetical protein